MEYALVSPGDVPPFKRVRGAAAKALAETPAPNVGEGAISEQADAPVPGV